jgi:multiple sugar transport system substrate-binding protein
MKYLLLVLFLCLLLASLVTHRLMPESASARPVLYWVTDANPARDAQIHFFHLWQVKHGHSVTMPLASEDEARSFLAVQSRLMQMSLREINPQLKSIVEGTSSATNAYPITITLPLAEMRTDSANSDLTKRIIQGVSGVGGDIMDTQSGQTMRQLQGIGLLSDITESGGRLGFSPDRTYPALLPEITIPSADGSLRQYMFPCNVNASGYIVNLEAFERVGMPAPPHRWTIEEFERIGTEYVKRANAGLPRNRFFFVGSVDNATLRRTFGADTFNETMTASIVDSAPSVEAATTYLRWLNDLRLLPSAADKAGFASDSGYSGQEPQLFHSGNYAMTFTGRFTLIQYRQFNIDRAKAGRPAMKLAVSEMPHAAIPITSLFTRAAVIYSGGKHRELAELFLAYLASEDYNMQVVRDADALPPNPEFTERPEFLNPAPDPSKGIYAETERDFHRPFKEMAETIAVATSHSPFILTVVAQREVARAEEAFINGNVSPADALASAKRRIDTEIARNLSENASLRPLYEKKRAQQQQIDAMKARIDAFSKSNTQSPIPDELKIPTSMIDNPCHRVLYAKQGWLRNDAVSRGDAQ